MGYLYVYMKIVLSEEQYRVLVERSKKDNLFNKEDDYKDIRDIISNYTSLNDLAKDNKNLYNRIRTRTPELLDNLERDGGSLTKWNLDNVKELIGNYKTLSDFRNENPKIYKQIKNRKMTQELLGHLQRGGSLEKWDIENVKNIISTYTNLIDFRRNHEHLYNQIKGRGLNDELLGHLEKRADKYTEDDIRKLAEPFKYKRDFEKKYPSQYDIARKNGWLNNINKWEPLGNKENRMVYVYEFRDKKGNPLAVYVGLTGNEEQRHKEHTSDWVPRSGKVSPVYRYIMSNNIKPIKKIVSNGYIPYRDAVDMECYYQNDFYKKDKYEDGSLVWTPLHSMKCGGLGGFTKWTEEKIRKEAEKYTSISDFYNYSRPAFSASKRRGLFNDITKNMITGRRLRKEYLVSQNNFNTFINGTKTDISQLNLLDISCNKKVTSENESKFLQRLKSIIIKNKLSLSGRRNQNTLVSLNRKLYWSILTHDKITPNNKWISYLFPNHVKGIGESKLSLIGVLGQ